METLDHYVQEAAAELALIRMGESVVRNICQLLHSTARFHSPPPHPWLAFFDRDRQTAGWTSKLAVAQFRPQKLLFWIQARAQVSP